MSVAICAYTLQRWELLQDAVRSVREAEPRPVELIICVDHNEELFRRATREWAMAEGPLPIRVVNNRFEGHSGSARNTAIEVAIGDIVAFLDDDAVAEPDWLARLIDAYTDDCVMAVGGRPVPRFETACPNWFPPDFYWLFGCAYAGLPVTRSPVRHLIGTVSSARRAALTEIGGYHSDTHDDMDICHRITHRYGSSSVVYDPSVVVTHFVPATRSTWTYFRKRVYTENRDKVIALVDMGPSANVQAELEFVRRQSVSALRMAAQGMARREPHLVIQSLCSVAGMALGGLGFLDGKIRLRIGRYKPSETRGIGLLEAASP